MPPFENVVPALARALSGRGFDALTPVQDAVLGGDLQEADLIVSAQTGSGKTVAFGLTLAAALLGGRERFEMAGAPLALVIAPTRELALQVTREFEWLFEGAGARIASCVGGMDAREERRALQNGAHIVIGTPGRLVDHIRRGALEMGALRAVVLDEADEMLNLGFREELEHILDASPPERRTLMFSATIPRAIEALARKYQRSAVRVNTVSEQRQHIDIEYRALVVASHESENAIFNVLRFYDATNALVFCATRVAVTRLASRFADRGFSVVALSGELSQSERTHALQAMRDHRAQVCVATDVAARGIDLPDLDLVIHADLPKNNEALLHRSGRTGRAGRKGTSVLIVPHPARRRTERLLRDASIDARWGEPPSADDVRRRDDERLLGEPALSAPPETGELEIVKTLLARHGAEQIAAAFVRLHRQGKAAPEDLASAPPGRERRQGLERSTPSQRHPRPDRSDLPSRRESPERAPRDAFENGVWVSLSVGRAQSAEPRWLIPMLCKAGGITKADIGAIRIQQNETHLEIDPARVQAFFDQLGPHGRLEKSITATRMPVGPHVASGRTEGARRPSTSRDVATPAKADSAIPGVDSVGASERQRAHTPHRGVADAMRRDARAPEGKRPDGKRPGGKRPDGKRPDGKRPDATGHNTTGHNARGHKARGSNARGTDAKRPDAKRPEAERTGDKRPDKKRPDATTAAPGKPSPDYAKQRNRTPPA